MSFKPYDIGNQTHWLHAGFPARGFVQSLSPFGGGNFITEAVTTMEHGKVTFLLGQDELETSVSYIADKLINDEPWRTQTYQHFYEIAEQYFGLCDRFHDQPLPDRSDAELLSAFQELLKLQQDVQVLGALLHGIVPEGTRHLMDAIKNGLITTLGSNQNYADVWDKLTQSTKLSYSQQKDVAVARLAEEAGGKTPEFILLAQNRERQLEAVASLSPRGESAVYASKKKPRPSGRGSFINENIAAIHHKYAWIGYDAQPTELALQTFTKDFEQATASNANLHLVQQLQVVAQEQQALMDSLHFNERSRKLIMLAQETMLESQYIRDVETHGLWAYEPFLVELAKRKNVADWHALLFLLPWELAEFMTSNKPTIDELKNRQEYSCLNVRSDAAELLLGESARRFVSLLEVQKMDTTPS